MGLATDVARSIVSLSELTGPERIPANLKLEVTAKANVPGALDIPKVDALRRFGCLGFWVPLSFEGYRDGEDSVTYFSVCPEHWFVTFGIDGRRVPKPSIRRGIFESLLDGDHWPVKLENSGKESFAFKCTDPSLELEAYEKQPRSLSLTALMDWHRGFEALSAAAGRFEVSRSSWSWSFETNVLNEPVEDANTDELFARLSSLELPMDEATLTFDTHLEDLSQLEELRQNFGPDDKAVTDLVVLKLAPGYKAEIDLISTSKGHFVEANLKGGWGDEERAAFETLLGVPLVDDDSY